MIKRWMRRGFPYLRRLKIEKGISQVGHCGLALGMDVSSPVMTLKYLSDSLEA
jgi:hypothetical protein